MLYVATLHFNLCTYKKYAQSSRPKVTRKWEKSTLKISGDSSITQQKISFSFKINRRPIQIAQSIFFWKGIFYKCTFLHLKEADICKQSLNYHIISYFYFLYQELNRKVCLVLCAERTDYFGETTPHTLLEKRTETGINNI